MDSESIDLIYLDPPFNSNRNYAAPIGSQAAGAAFKDTWTLSDVDNAWHGEIADREPALYQAIHTAELTHGKGMKSYLIMMAIRLLEMKRVLKKTGSIYLHCDPTASHYLKLLMDAVFGRTNFRNEIIWRRNSGNNAGKQYGRNHDTLLYYVVSNQATWNGSVADDYSPEQRSRFKIDQAGNLYKAENLTAPGVAASRSFEWRGAVPGNRSWRYSKEKLEELWEAGLILTKRDGKTPRLDGLKTYLGPDDRPKVQSIWTDIHRVANTSKERTGYPTQKPIALLERIIKASSNEADVVLDPFCGCATTCVAAERLGRQWIGIDISEKAVDLVQMRLEKEVGLFGTVIHRTDIPKRSEKLPNYQTHKHTLYGKQEGLCNGCQTQFPFRNMTVDHIIARRHGGTDALDNLQLLCGACNSTKGTGTQAELLAKLQEQGII
jgi:site-specific DNA-methyltransferase (adenine-specific)